MVNYLVEEKLKIKYNMRKNYKNSIKINIYKGKEFIKEVSSIAEASRLTGAKAQNIYKAINGYKTTLNGFTLIKSEIKLQDIINQIVGNQHRYIYNIDNVNKFIEYGELKHDNHNNEFYIDSVGTISFDEILTILRDKKIEFILD
jgi:hypothetical protein